MASVVSALLPQVNLSRVLSTFQTLNFAASLIKVGFLLLVISLTRVLNISWKGLPAGIALGLGVSAAADVGASALMSRLANLSSGTVDMIRMTGFNVCVMIWLAYMIRREKACDLPQNLSFSDVEAPLQELHRMMGR